VRLLLLVLAASLLAPSAAWAQATDSRNRAVIILDASKSMNEDAHNGGTRLDAAKHAVDQLLDRLPAGAPLGLRVYGAKIDQASRAEACRDTELTVPVGPLDKNAMRGTVDALQGKGRTPIGSSLLATPDDLGSGAGRRSVVLVSDGGDNCAPPDPCKAAEQVSKQGVDLSISVIGLQVNERVRKQLECIARVGGGSYVDVQDAGRLGDELAAALARAFRSYEPAGTKVTGGLSQTQGPTLGSGQFQDVMKPGEERWYAIHVPAGRRLLASVTAIPSKQAGGQGALQTDLLDPAGQNVDRDSEVMYGKDAGEAGRERSQALRTAGPAGAGDVAPGRYVLHVKIADEGIDPLPVPLELGVQLLAPGEAPGLAREPGKLAPDGTAGTAATPKATPAAKANPSGASWLVIAVAAVAGLVLGVGGALVLGRQRAG
jgi:Ca-activated chloride channel family protein